MFVSRGLVGPKSYRNSSMTKGKQVNIPVPFDCNKIYFVLTFRDMLSRAVALSKRLSLWRTVMVRIW